MKKLLGLLVGLIFGTSVACVAYAEDVVRLWPEILTEKGISVKDANGQTGFDRFKAAAQQIPNCGDESTIAVSCVGDAFFEAAYQAKHFKGVSEADIHGPLGKKTHDLYVEAVKKRFKLTSERIKYTEFRARGLLYAEQGGYTTLPQKEVDAIISTATNLVRIDEKLIKTEMGANSMTPEQYEARLAELDNERNALLSEFGGRLTKLEKEVGSNSAFITDFKKIFPEKKDWEAVKDGAADGTKAQGALSVLGDDPKAALEKMQATVDELSNSETGLKAQFEALKNSTIGEDTVQKIVDKKLTQVGKKLIQVGIITLGLIIPLLWFIRTKQRDWMHKHFVTKKALESQRGDIEPVVESQALADSLKNFDRKLGEVQRGVSMALEGSNKANQAIGALEKKVEGVVDQTGTLDIRFADGGEAALQALALNQELTVTVLVNDIDKFDLIFKRVEMGKYFCLDSDKKIRDLSEKTPISDPLRFVRRNYRKGMFSALEKAYKSPDLAAA